MSFSGAYSSRRKNRKRAELYRAQNGYCGICGKRLKCLIKVTLDHVKPLSRGGGRGERNLIAAHRHCNEGKADRPPTGCEVIWLEAVNSRLTS